jgi:hypothetical protein
MVSEPFHFISEGNTGCLLNNLSFCLLFLIPLPRCLAVTPAPLDPVTLLTVRPGHNGRAAEGAVKAVQTSMYYPSTEDDLAHVQLSFGEDT